MSTINSRAIALLQQVLEVNPSELSGSIIEQICEVIQDAGEKLPVLTEDAHHNDTCSMAFGRPSKHSTCPRCQELKAGSKPRKGWGDHKKEFERRSLEAIRAHNCIRSNCGSVCTFGEW